MSALLGDERLVRFLVDDLPADERAAVEEEVFASDDRFAELEAVEEELVESYCDGELPAPLRAQFEAAYLGSDPRRRRVELLRSLGRLARQRQPLRTGRESAPPAWPLRWAAGLAAATLLVALATLAWAFTRAGALEAERAVLQARVAEHARRAAEREARLVALRDELAREQARIARLAASLAESPRTATSVVSLLLGAPLTRGSEEAPRLELTPEVALVRLQLPAPASGDGPFRARLETVDGAPLWQSGELPARASGTGRSVTVDVDPARLPAGHLVVVLATSGPEGPRVVGEYAFRVVDHR